MEKESAEVGGSRDTGLDPAPRLSRRAAVGGLLAAAMLPATLARAWGQRSAFTRPRPLEAGVFPGGFRQPEEAPVAVAEGVARYQHTATALADGRVLIAGGYHLDPGFGGGRRITPLASVEIYDPARGAWYAVASLQTPRARHAAVLLPDGRVLVLGGYYLQPLATVELYDPLRNLWSEAPPLSMPRFDHAVSLAGGQIVITGGMNQTTLSGVEFYGL